MLATESLTPDTGGGLRIARDCRFEQGVSFECQRELNFPPDDAIPFHAGNLTADDIDSSLWRSSL
jgi:hypothetical protein